MKKVIPGYKNENGVYIKEPKAESEPHPEGTTPPYSQKSLIPADLSIDDLMKSGLENIWGIMRAIKVDVGTGLPSRETVQNLKDVMTMLHELKKKEKELLDNLSDEELEELLKKDSK